MVIIKIIVCSNKSRVVRKYNWNKKLTKYYGESPGVVDGDLGVKKERHRTSEFLPAKPIVRNKIISSNMNQDFNYG